MRYEYQCLECGVVTELECSIYEKDERERELSCFSCGSKSLRRIFGAFIPRPRGTSACSSCPSSSTSACSSCPLSR
ncbi:MAG: hypothetical protein RMK18_06315 [Armatimonadota bacterium]|nr:hypothetical protein [Armatimonadota bacterium]MCX7777701.1 hypothetical protein [Armatimonadota bacterium]MDW8025460.1 hypothetical protein [Armatimonadota bacterium]